MGLFDSLFNAAWSASTKGITNDPNWVQHVGKGTYYSDAALNQYFRDYDKAINLDLMKQNFDYENYLSSSAYQRAVKDMEAAGINPASLGGSAPAASTPNVNANFHSSAPNVSRPSFFSGSDSMLSSLFNAVITNSRDAQKVAGRELLDNARHEHKMEEIRESTALKHAINQEKNLEHISKADYYDEMARSIRHNRGW